MLGDDNTLGSWELPQELVMLRDTARRFMREKVIPAEDKVEHDAFTLPEDVLLKLQADAREIGLWNVQTPSEFGGAGLNILGQCIVCLLYTSDAADE